ncbi:alpha/beta hydrolase family protein [Schleiferilactobacillus shenzhenensis]|uniref:BD-FAE-like domain-containing protein n=1 Tax=Schleiferilactobacillus shenzhenensis LY-73 TaxID=1231336 RepID=U4TNE2_9LACO|nr:alpha/beta hydrolase [Schleiferilactobacillus shenzhenensis]ERL64940.1 hypothetical protein L248_3102 [Schleiferilactobacillus shenzhenensis LY-73]
MNTIKYGTDPLQTADIYEPQQRNGAAIIFIHGGAWLRGDKAGGKHLATVLSDHGYVVAAINYRLAPAAQMPAAQEDLDSFVAFMQQSSDFSSLKLGLLGVSVGGTMALTTSMHTGLPVSTWSAVVQSQDWINRHPGVKPSLDGKKELGLTDQHEINAAFYQNFINTYLGTVTQDKLAQLDPLNQETTKPGPIAMMNSLDEIVPVEDVMKFFKRVAKVQPESRLTFFPGWQHAQGYEAQALDQTRAFFDLHLL